MWGREFGTDSFLARPRRKMFPAVFEERRMEMGIHFGSALFSPSCTLGSCLSVLLLCPSIAATGPVVCYGMGGCLDLVALVMVTLGLLLWGI